MDLGRLGYRETYARQLEVWAEVHTQSRPDTLILVEHDPVLTLGANFHSDNLILTRAEYASRGIAIEETDRGGDVTYHGPGQLVAYPIFDLRRRGQDLHRWLRDIEQAVIQAMTTLGLKGERKPPHTGVWIHDRKVCAIGIKVKRWVSLHGLALNCDLDLRVFDLFVPCGIREYGVTSLSQELRRPFTVPEAKAVLTAQFRSF